MTARTYVVASWRCPWCRTEWQTAQFATGDVRFRVETSGPEVCPECWKGERTRLEGTRAGEMPEGCMLSFGEVSA